METFGYAAFEADAPLRPYRFARRELRADDIAIEILYCGVCHSDLHMARNDWGETVYPLVPGHEIVGRVIGTGAEVSRFTEGDRVAVGCMVDSCRTCDQCLKGEEQFCRDGVTETYGMADRLSGAMTQGGYARHIVVREAFVLRLPARLDPAKAAPLLCAGITTYSPLKTWDVGEGTRLGVIGMGGLAIWRSSLARVSALTSR